LKVKIKRERIIITGENKYERKIKKERKKEKEREREKKERERERGGGGEEVMQISLCVTSSAHTRLL